MVTKPIQFKRKLLASSVSACLLGCAGVTIAQSEEVISEEVLVRGIKSSLEHSLDIKRNANQIVEAITADDIGKMPDQNVAESLQRLPGIQIDRRDGEGTKVRIRGLDQNITLMNGETFTSGLEYFQLGEWKQEFDGSLEGVPSELLGGVEVYKTPTASMIEGGIGGVINLKTRNAFVLDDLLLAGNVKLDRGNDAEEANPSGFVVVGNNWDDTFAAIGSISVSQKTVHTDFIQNFSRENSAVECTEGGVFADIETGCVDPEDTSVALGQSYFAPGMFYVMDSEQERERIGASLNLQWRPTDSLELGLDWFHSDIKIDNVQYVVKHPMHTDGPSGIDESRAYTIDSSNPIGILTHGFVDVSGAMETNTAGETSDISTDNLTLKMAWDDGGKLRIKGALTMSEADLEQRAGYADSRVSEYSMRAWRGDDLVIDTPITDTDDDGELDEGDGILDAPSPTGWAGTVVNPSPGGNSERYYEYRSGELPRLEYAFPGWLADPDYHTYKSHWALGSEVETETSALRLDFEYDLDFGDLKTAKFGLRIAEEETNFIEQRYLTDFSRTTGVQTPNIFAADGSIATPTNFDPMTAPDATNAGVQEAVYYDLCGNGGIPAGQTCDIDGDGEDDNQPFGPWGYFLDAAIGLKAFDLTTSDGTPMAVALYGDAMADSGRWDYSPGYLPWQTYTAHDDVVGAAGDPSRYVILDDFFPSGGYNAPAIAFQNGDAIVRDPAAWIDSIAPNSPIGLFEVPLESWKIKQSTSAFYGELDFEGDTVPYSLNVGLRVVQTEVDVTSAETTPESSSWSLATDGWNSQGVLLTWDVTTKTKDYWDFLPSLNFSLDTSDDTKLRFSASKVIARPNLQALGKGFSKNFTRTNTGGGDDYFAFTGGSAGNPALEPYRASQADISFEYYMGDLSYVSAGVFVKAVESFIAGETRLERQPDFSPQGYGIGGVSRPVNGSGGSVSGLELAYLQDFDNGFGLGVNYTYSGNSADVSTTTNPNVGLPGISENAFNIIAFYENDVVSGRVSYTWRDEYLSPFRSSFDYQGLENAASEFYNDYGQWDASLTWNVLENVSVDAALLNITGEAQSSYLAYPGQPMTYTSQEPRAILGMTFRL